MGNREKINPDDLTEEGYLMYCVILLLEELEKAPDRNIESFTNRIKKTKNLLIVELLSF